jgi:hypothetical protein
MRPLQFRHGQINSDISFYEISIYKFNQLYINHNTVIDLINVLPGNSSVNTSQHATINEAVFCMSSAPSTGGKTGFCNPLLGNGSVNTFPRIGPCYESGDVINKRDGGFHRVCAECL